MDLKSFIKKYTGQKVDYDKKFGPQCVDLFRQYCADVLNVGHTGAVEGAKDLYLKYDELPKEKEVFARIEKKRISRYMPGTVVVFGATSANRFGHVAIVVDEFEGELIVFEQDGFRQDGAKLVIRDTKNVLGVLVAYDFR